MPAVDTEHRTDDKTAAADDGRTIEAIDTDTKDTQLDDHEQKDTKAEKFERRVSKAPRQLSISLRAAAFGSVVCILAATAGSVPGSGVSDGGVSVPDVRGPSRESLW